MEQRNTGLLLFFGYVASKEIDVSTVTRINAELRAMGFDARPAVFDADYYTSSSTEAPRSVGVLFLIRMRPKLKIREEVVAEVLDVIEGGECHIHNGRIGQIRRARAISLSMRLSLGSVGNSG